MFDAENVNAILSANIQFTNTFADPPGRNFYFKNGVLLVDLYVVENMVGSVSDRWLDTAGIPDPDLLIRTSGELRLSNYLLWQLAYSELYVTDCLWPDFNKEELLDSQSPVVFWFSFGAQKRT